MIRVKLMLILIREASWHWALIHRPIQCTRWDWVPMILHLQSVPMSIASLCNRWWSMFPIVANGFNVNQCSCLNLSYELVKHGFLWPSNYLVKIEFIGCHVGPFLHQLVSGEINILNNGFAKRYCQPVHWPIRWAS